MKHVKWWGWGEEGSFRYDDKPAFAAFVKAVIDIDVTKGHSGACLYFTFAFRPSAESRSLEEYDVVKRAIQQGFIDLGGTLSHHHAVGVEHAPWLSQDISPVGVKMIRSLLNGMDPGRNLNPGKIIAQDD
jgi:FAD/FMN-containing dehydrogenase